MSRISRTLSSLADHLLAPFLLAAFLSIPAAYYVCRGRPDGADSTVRAAVESRQLSRLDSVPLADLNAPDPATGVTPLMAAASLGDPDTVEHLLARGVDVNAFDPAAGSALMCAAHFGHAPVVLALLRHGADPTPFTSSGCDALWSAVLSGDAPTIAALLHTNADPNSPRRKYPLLSGITATGDRPDLVRLLLSAGCDPTPPDPDTGLPLPLAFLHDHAPNSAHTLLSLTQPPPTTNPLTPPDRPR